jgi:hypothetical protein
MDVDITEEQRDLQQRARRLAEDLATRAAHHDRAASDPMENHRARYLVGEAGTRHPRRADARPAGSKALGGPGDSGR